MQKMNSFSMSSSQKRHAFTLLEMSIVLLVLAMAIAAVTVGRNLITVASYRRQVSQIVQIQAAVESFNAKYNCYPGDCLDPTSIPSFTYSGDGDGFLPQTWNGDENKGFWLHLNASGIYPELLVSHGALAGMQVPAAKVNSAGLINAYGNITYAQNVLEFGTQGVNGAVKTADIMYIDKKMDDNSPTNGVIRSSGYGSGATTVYSSVPCFPLSTTCNTGTTKCVTAGYTYDVTATGTSAECNMLFLMGRN